MLGPKKNRIIKEYILGLFLFIFSGGIVFSSCSKVKEQNQETSDFLEKENIEEFISQEDNLKELKPELYILVEGAVDTWFFYNLLDYRSYEPIIRSTDYIPQEDIFIHKCRYRARTLNGGFETVEKTFRVSLDVDAKSIDGFQVEDITGGKSLTEK